MRVCETHCEEVHLAEKGYKPRIVTVVQQVEEFERQIQLGKKNWLADLVGQWPGDESDAEFERLLKDID